MYLVLHVQNSALNSRSSSLLTLHYTITFSLLTKMLRRNPTPITLTTEDIAAYDDHRLLATTTENSQPNNNHNSNNNTGSAADGGKLDPNDELKPLPGDRARVRVGGAGGVGMGGGGGAVGGAGGREREQRIVGSGMAVGR